MDKRITGGLYSSDSKIIVMEDGVLGVLNARLFTQSLNIQGKGHSEY